nr:hypothetical protein [Tanacetum cinerariifolium]
MRGNHKHYARMSLLNPSRHVVPAAVFTQSKLVPINAVRPVTTAVPKTSVTRPRQAKIVVTMPNLPPRRHINHSQSLKARNMSYLSDFEELNGGYVTFGGNPNGGNTSRKGKIRTGKLDFDDVYFVKELKFNLFSVLQMCDKKNSVIFTDTECLVLSPESKLPDENKVLLRVPGENNMTLIEAARTMLVDLLLPIPFWAEAVNTACYVQNRVLVTKPQNKTPYELLHGITPSIRFMRPFGCPVTILNTLNSLGKFDEKVDEGFLVGYSVSSSGPTWLFDIDTLTKTMNYQPVTIGNQSYPSAGIQEQFNAEKAREESDQQYVLFPVWSSGSTNPQNIDGDAAINEKDLEFEERKPESEVNISPSKFEDFSDNSINEVNAAGTPVPAVGKLSPNSTNTFSADGPSNVVASLTHGKSLCIDTSQYPDDPNMPKLEDITYSDDEDDVGVEADFNTLETSITVSPILTTRVHKNHPVTQIIGDLSSATQTRSMTRVAKDQGGLSEINNDDFHTFARIEAIRLFLAYASFMGFMVYQMDVQSAFLYGTIEEQVYVCQPLGFEDPDHPDKVYKVVKIYVDDIIFGSTNKDLCKDFEKLMKDKFQMSSIGVLTFFLGLQVKQKKDGIFISQDKYVTEILRKFGMIDRKSASNPTDTEKHLLKDPHGVNTPRCDEGRLELIELTVFLLLSDEKVRVEVSAVDLQVSAVRLILLLSIKYALTVNPNIYVSCIKQFWTSVVVKNVNDVMRLKALVDKKKVVVTKATIRDALRLDDAEGVNYLPNEEIFTELARMGYEKPSTKLTFYKAVFSSQKQVGDLSLHSTKYTSPALTQKLFANMRRVGKGFSGVDTPLFEDMLVVLEFGEGEADEVHVKDVNAAIATEGVVSADDDVVPTAVDKPSIPSPTPITLPPQSSQDQPSTSQVHLTPP